MTNLFDLQLFAEDADTAAEGAESVDKSKDTGSDKGAEKGNQDADKASESKAKYTDADVDAMLNRKFAEWQKKQQKAVDEAKKLAEMDATQKAEYERDQLKKELEDYKRRDSLAAMSKQARKMLADQNISIPDELLGMMVTTEAEDTKAAVDSFAKLFTEAVEAAVKDRLKGDTPRKGAGGGIPAKTKEQIMAIRDPELRQAEMLKHRELFNI